MARVLAPGGTHAERHGDWRWTCKQAQKASQCLQLVSIHPQVTIINHHEAGHPWNVLAAQGALQLDKALCVEPTRQMV